MDAASRSQATDGPESAAPAALAADRPSAGAPESDPPAGEGSGDDVPAPPPTGGRTPFARRHDDPQRVDGGGRWSVDSTRRRCHGCGEELPEHRPFHSVLGPAPEPEPDEEGGEPATREEAELFVRRDYCEACFASSPPETVFAHWRGVLPPPLHGQRKVVNLASLLAHFHTLVETPGGTDHGDDDLDADLDGPEDGAGGEGDAEDPAPADLSPERARLAYLLGLFLVRRRMLRWDEVGDGILRLTCKESDRPVRLRVPDLTEEELAVAVEEFESLFR